MNRIAITYSNSRKAEPYAEAIREAGLEPVLIAAADRVRSLAGFAGLLLTGGSDINPKLYGQPPDSRTHPPDDARDDMELTLLSEALRTDAPVLAICRGMQLFNVAHAGGTLAQHIEGHELRPADASLPAHEVLVQPDTLMAQIAGESHLEVNSRHHQAAANIGADLIVSARAPDGVVEALERPGRRFALGVQWHPEDQRRFAPHRRMFEEFRRACETPVRR